MTIAEKVTIEDSMIPWRSHLLRDIATKIQDGTHFSPKLGGSEYLYITSKNIGPGYLKLDSVEMISESEHRKIYQRCDVRFGDLLLTKDGANTGNSAISTFGDEVSLLSSVAFIRMNRSVALERYILHYFLSSAGRKQIEDAMAGNAITRLTLEKINNLVVPLPPVNEQSEIADVLDEVDTLIASLELLFGKKQFIKQGMMQQLLTGKTRLPGFAGPWSEIQLRDGAIILDNLRIPLSAPQRTNRTGPFPYCGANGVLDYIDDYMIDDDVVLLAEDGGNFDQWRTRPIAYRMRGKIWVNNHAHVLKAKPDSDTGFLFYALEHKDITPVISSGTRSKLTRGELIRINILRPDSVSEQRAIAKVIDDANEELDVLQCRLAKVRRIKSGMMQQLLTGRTRLQRVEVVA